MKSPPVSTMQSGTMWTLNFPCSSTFLLQTDLLREGDSPVPYPTKFKDAWDDMSVKMPCSEKNLFPLETEVN